jgi:Zn-dependent peptidase ImmA (M78 family)
MKPTLAEKKQNQEATAFALALLIPERDLRAQTGGQVDIFDDDDALGKLAKRYDVPVPLLCFRIGMLAERWNRKHRIS